MSAPSCEEEEENKAINWSAVKKKNRKERNVSLARRYHWMVRHEASPVRRYSPSDAVDAATHALTRTCRRAAAALGVEVPGGRDDAPTRIPPRAQRRSVTVTRWSDGEVWCAAVVVLATVLACTRCAK